MSGIPVHRNPDHLAGVGSMDLSQCMGKRLE